MNFRTTILLLVVLAVAAALWFVAGRDTPIVEQTPTEEAGQTGKKLLELSPANVSKVAITPASGQKMVLERVGTSEWKLTEPVKSGAESFKADELVREVLDLRTSGSSDAAGKGLDQPQYVVELTDKENKTTTLNVGMRSPVGDILYARVGSEGQAQVVSASLVTQLEKPASDYRKTHLLSVTNDKITGVTVNHGDQTLELAKAGDTWKIVKPQAMPGDSGQINSLLTAITGLNAVKFVAEDATAGGSYGFSKPQMTVSISTAPPTTQPATASTQPAASTPTVIKFGRPQDVLEKNVYAIASDTGPVVTIAATDLAAFKKTPLELRDRAVVNIDADAVSRISITTEKSPTTQPATQPATTHAVTLERRSEVTQAGPPVPATTQATTGPTTTTALSTAPASQPAVPQSKWLLASDTKGDASDEKVQELLTAMHPLRAEKFLEQFPTAQAVPAAKYVIKVSTRVWADAPAKEVELTITDPGGEAKLIGQADGATFELDRAVLEKLTANFAATKPEAAGPPMPALPSSSALPSIPELPTGPIGK